MRPMALVLINLCAAIARASNRAMPMLAVRQNSWKRKKNGCHVTHLFRYEDQSVIQSFLEQRLNVKITLQKRNVSPVMDLTLSSEIEALYRRKKPEEFELYDSIQ